jgi:hypothetical protein
VRDYTGKGGSTLYSPSHNSVEVVAEDKRTWQAGMQILKYIDDSNEFETGEVSLRR